MSNFAKCIAKSLFNRPWEQAMPAPRVATNKIRYTNLRRRSSIATPRLSIGVYLGGSSKNIQVQILYMLQRTVFSNMAQPEKQRHIHAMLMSNNNACKLAWHRKATWSKGAPHRDDVREQWIFKLTSCKAPRSDWPIEKLVTTKNCCRSSTCYV